MALLYGAGMSAQNLTQVPYADGSQKLNGLVTDNAGKQLPGVLVLPVWKGIDQEAKTAALELEKQGYIVFVADIYGEGNIPTDNASAGKAGALPGKIAVIGYCFGGSGALEVARAGFPVLGIVSIHGGLAKDSTRVNVPLNTKMLIENAAEDPGVNPQVMSKLTKEMNEGKADWEVITYAYCKHTFTDPASPDYNPMMAQRAWQHTLLFLKELLQ